MKIVLIIIRGILYWPFLIVGGIIAQFGNWIADIGFFIHDSTEIISGDQDRENENSDDAT